MRKRSINRWLFSVLLLVLFVGLSYALYPFLIDEEQYRRPLEAGASMALGRQVTIKGPLSLSFSLHPTLVLEHVQIANPPWASRPDLLQATRLEGQLSFLALLKRELVIDKILVDGLDLLLEEGPEDSNNWTFGSSSKPSFSSQTESSIFATMSEGSFSAIQRSTIAYQPYLAPSPETTITIIEGSVLPVNDHTREFSVRGTFRDTPFTIKLIGGKVINLIDLTQPWSMDGSVATETTTLAVKGQIIGPPTTPSLELTGELRGERLNDLDPLFDTNLPHYGPYELMTSLSFSEDTLKLSNARLKIGQSDLAGLFTMKQQGERTAFIARLTSNTVDANDFRSSESGPPTSESTRSTETFISQIGMQDIDIDLQLAVNAFLIDRQDFGKVALSAKLDQGQMHVKPFRAETFGGVITGNFELDGNHPAPKAIVEVTAPNWNYGQVLHSFDVTSAISGSTDLDISISGQGATWQDFLDHTTLSINAGPSTAILGTKDTSDHMALRIHQATVKTTPGKAMNVRLQGEIKEKPIDVGLVTGSLAQFTTPDKPWPISLFARSEDAALAVKGRMKSGPEGMRIALATSLKGHKLNGLDPDLPPSGPYVLQAQLFNNGSHYSLKDVQVRVGQSDVSGSMSVDMGKDIPQLSGSFSSTYFNMEDFSTPGDISISAKSFQALDAEFVWEIKEMHAKAVQLGNLYVDGNLNNGRLAINSFKGNLFDQKHAFAEFQSSLTLNTTTDIPTLSGKTSIQNLDLGYVFRDASRNSHVIGATKLDAQFSSKGHTLFTMLTQPTFTIGTQDLRLAFIHQQDDSETVLSVTQASLSSNGGSPLLFNAEGSLKEKPFTMTSSAGSLKQLLDEIPEWPLAMTVQFPHVLIGLKGHFLFPINQENFNFHVSVKGDSWKELPFLTEMKYPDLGPFTVTGLLTQFQEGYRLAELNGQWGPNDVAGQVTFLTNGPRPKLVATLRSDTNEFSFLTKALSPSTEAEERTILKTVVGSIATMGQEAGKSIADMGSQAGQVVTKSLGLVKTDEEEEEKETPSPHSIPDFEFPVAALRALDLDIAWQIHRVESRGKHLGNFSYELTLEDGLLTIGPLSGTLWDGAFDGKIELDASEFVPTLSTQLKIEDLDLGFLDDTVGAMDLVNGEIDLIRLNLKSRGTTLHEVLERANGEAELVEGPMEITNEYIDFWAADVFTLTLTKAWEKEKATKLNCAVGYFDIVEGEVQSDAILFDTQRITVGGFGTLNLRSEAIDLILTPQPKNPTLITLGHPVRISGNLSEPEVTKNKLRIAQGGAWGLLGLVNPIGFTLVIPKIAGTTLGTGNDNPCEAAMADKALTVQEVSELQEDFWDWMVRKMKGVFQDNDDPQQLPPNSESGEP